jgi:hypothetical protein
VPQSGRIAAPILLSIHPVAKRVLRFAIFAPSIRARDARYRTVACGWFANWFANSLHPPISVAYGAMSDRVKLARAIAARTEPRFIEIPREKRSGVPFTDEQLTAIRGGLTAEEYRWNLIRDWLEE